MIFENVRQRFKDENGVFVTQHTQTNANQVLIMENGVSVSNIQERLLDGERVSGISVASLTKSGIYIARNMAGMPFTAENVNTDYIIRITSVGDIVKQELSDHIRRNTFTRYIVNGNVAQWTHTGAELWSLMTTLEGRIGQLNGLQTSTRVNLVAAINELHGRNTNMNNILNGIDDRVEEIASRNLDSTFLRRDGANNMYGEVRVPNDTGFIGLTSGGAHRNIGRVMQNNAVQLGDAQTQTSIHANGGVAYVSNGTTNWRIFHSGHMGQGSGLSADTFRGEHLDTFARRNQPNVFTASNTFSNHVDFNNAQIRVNAANGARRATISADANGLNLRNANETAGVTITSAGHLNTSHDIRVQGAVNAQRNIDFWHGLDNSSRFRLRMNTAGQFALSTVWNGGATRNVFTVNAGEVIPNFGNGIRIEGTNILQGIGVPPNSLGQNGDIYIRRAQR